MRISAVFILWLFELRNRKKMSDRASQTCPLSGTSSSSQGSYLFILEHYHSTHFSNSYFI